MSQYLVCLASEKVSNIGEMHMVNVQDGQEISADRSALSDHTTIPPPLLHTRPSRFQTNLRGLHCTPAEVWYPICKAITWLEIQLKIYLKTRHVLSVNVLIWW